MLSNVKAHRGKILLLLILLLTAYLTCYKIWEEGYGNQYYTAAVKSMLSSWHNFFFVSFDRGGFISVDKPALGLWLQCLFALVFGVHGWSVILPEALCSIGSVAVLYHIVKRSYGEGCGLLAAFFLAVTPIFIAVSRTNNLDAPLVLSCLLAIWALIIAAEKGSLKWLLVAVAMIGVGFNIKMLQAFMFVPAIYLVYFFTAECRLKRRFFHLVIATVVLLVVSLSWCFIVDMTPAAARPFVGSSSTNSTIELAVGYNGILRALPIQIDALSEISGAVSQVPNEGNAAGILRLFNREMAGQASWMLPMAVFGMVALFIKLFQKSNTEKKQALRQILLWGGIFIPMYVYFSMSSHIHRYYLIMFAPCLAALAAVALFEFRKHFNRDETTGKNRWYNLLLPLAITVTAAVQYTVLKTYYDRFSGVLALVIIVCTAVAVLLFVVAKLVKNDQKMLIGLALTVGIISLCVTPAYWAYTPIRFGTNVITPFAGPPLVSAPTNNGKITIVTNAWERKWYKGEDLYGDLIPKEAVEYMIANDNGSRYLLAVPNVMFSAPIILNNDISTMTLGGFIGSDKSMSVEDFNLLVQRGELQYFYVMDFMGSTAISEFAKLHGKKVDPALYLKNPPRMMYYAIYDLSDLKSN